MSIDMGVHAREVTPGVGWHFSSLLWGAVLCRPPRIVFVFKGRGRVVLGGVIVGAHIVGSSCCGQNGMVSYLGLRGREVQEVGHTDLK
jgi:hypothetical protein